MAKADDSIKDLQRRLGHLARLDGVLLRAADGPWIVTPLRWDPFALLAACRHGRAAAADLLAAIDCDGEPLRLTAPVLARARRDVKTLAAVPWLALVRAAPRHFRRFGPLDERWLAARAERIEALAASLQPEADAQDPVLELVADLHGPDSAAALADWQRRSAELGAGRRGEAMRRIEGLARRLDDPGAARSEPPGLRAALDAAACELARLTRLPGRAANRRLEPILRGVLTWPAPVGHSPVPGDSSSARGATGEPRPAPKASRSPPVPRDSSTEPTSGSLPAPKASRPVPGDSSITPAPSGPHERSTARSALAGRVRERGAELVHALGSTRSPARLAELRRVLGLHALAFPADPDEPAEPLLPDSLAHAEAQLRAVRSTIGPLRLSLPRALWLLRLPVEPQVCAALAPWVADGLSPALVEQVLALGKLPRLVALTGDATLARAYAGWLVRLVPHYRRLGVELDVEPDHFARLHASHREGLALLAHCLIEHHSSDERAVDARLARLRATLGLFAARPRRSEALLADLTRAPAGLGQRTFPAFARWLGEPPLLDRYCHLCELAGEPLALSNSLRRDFDRDDRIDRQREHLLGLPERTPALQARLDRLAAASTGVEVDRGWTLRRLAERVEQLQARAFARKLDALLADLLREAIGAAPPALSPAWRDALRFYLGGADRNRALLGELLRFAAAQPGRPIAPTLPRNQAWLARAAAFMRTGPWLAAHGRTLELAGQRHTLVVEHDPLEVLRMGIPFDTCLALHDGFNADSTVLNAVDINKRVLYLRDARGSVVARKLIAVSREHTLIGYRTYCSRDAEGRPAVDAAFDELCRSIAGACGIERADHGEPESIHPGFWYDDGVVAWDAAESATVALADYFAALGRPVPEDISDWAARHARNWLAHLRGDVEASLVALARQPQGVSAATLRATIGERLGPRELARRARREPILARIQLAACARLGVPQALRAALDVTPACRPWDDLASAVEHEPPSAALARAWLLAAAHERRHCAECDDHGLVHATVRMGPSLGCLPVAEILAACPVLDEHWAWMIEASHHCAHCREQGVEGVHSALASAYARTPDPDSVIPALTGRRGALAQTAALHLAARFSLTLRPCPLEHGLGASWFSRLCQRPVPAPRALRAVRQLLRARPELAEHPDMFAALVRQAGPNADHGELPRPLTAPFAALGELLLHLPDPARLLAPWLEPVADLERWEPDRWELHVHRCAKTPLRRQLARRAAGDPDLGEAASARRWLALLGDVETLERLGHREHLDTARALRHQQALRARPADAPPDLALLAPAGQRLDTADPRHLDLAGLRELARGLTPGSAELAPALLRRADLPDEQRHELLDRLVPITGPTPALHGPLAALLAAETIRLLSPELIARLACPALNEALLAHLRVGHHRLSFHPFYSRLERADCPDPAARDQLLATWTAEYGDETAYIDTPLGAHNLERFTTTLRAWICHGTPEVLLAMYRALADLHLQSRMLDALAELAPGVREQLREPAARWTPRDDDCDEKTARDWLLAALA